MTSKRFLVVVVLFALWTQVRSHAQSDLASIAGTVKDASAAVIPGVQVTVTNMGTGMVRTETTSSSGYYRVSDLPIGGYTVSFAKSGFSTLKHEGVTLLISQVAEIDVTLQVGEATENVVVTSAPLILQTEDSAVSTNLNSQAVSELPMNVAGTRALATFMFDYVPGVEGSDYESHIDGGMAFTKEVLIDGTSAVSMLGGYISESQPPMEAIGEFEADTAGISADAGRSGGVCFATR